MGPETLIFYFLLTVITLNQSFLSTSHSEWNIGVGPFVYVCVRTGSNHVNHLYYKAHFYKDTWFTIQLSLWGDACHFGI